MPIALNGSSSGKVTLQAGATAANNTLTLPDGNSTLVDLSSTQTLTNKTLTSPTLTTPTFSGAVALTSATLTSPTINGTPVMGASVLTLGTVQASTSGTSITFSSIPSWVRRVTLMLSGVSTNGTSNVLLQMGAASIETSGYLCTGSLVAQTNVSSANYTTGFGTPYNNASYDLNGAIVFNLLNASTNLWAVQGVVSASTIIATYFFSGSKALSGALQSIRVTTVNGTDAFDAGSINIQYE